MPLVWIAIIRTVFELLPVSALITFFAYLVMNVLGFSDRVKPQVDWTGILMRLCQATSWLEVRLDVVLNSFCLPVTASYRQGRFVVRILSN